MTIAHLRPGFSIVLATRLRADKALSDGSTRLRILSGVSHPIVSDGKLIEFVNSSADIIGAGGVNLATQTEAFRRRFTTRHVSFALKQNLYGRIVRGISREFSAPITLLIPSKELSEVNLTLGSQ